MSSSAGLDLVTVDTGDKKIVLTRVEQIFVEYYLQYGDPRKAAIAAGYKATSAAASATHMLRKPNVRARLEQRCEELKATTNEVFIRLTRHSRFDMGDFFTVRKKIYPNFNYDKRYRVGNEVECNDTIYYCVDDCQGIYPNEDKHGWYWKPTEREETISLDLVKAYKDGNTDLILKAGPNKYGNLEVEGVNSQAATVHLGKILGMFDRQGEDAGRQGNTTVNVTVNNVVQDEAAKELAEWRKQQQETIQVEMAPALRLLTDKQ